MYQVKKYTSYFYISSGFVSFVHGGYYFMIDSFILGVLLFWIGFGLLEEYIEQNRLEGNYGGNYVA